MYRPSGEIAALNAFPFEVIRVKVDLENGIGSSFFLYRNRAAATSRRTIPIPTSANSRLCRVVLAACAEDGWASRTEFEALCRFSSTLLTVVERPEDSSRLSRLRSVRISEAL